MEFFEKINNPNLPFFLNSYAEFVSQRYPSIVSYFKGLSNYIDKGVSDEISDLEFDQSRTMSLIEQSKYFISDDISSWDSVEMIDDIGVKLLVIRATPKWFRSSEGVITDSNPVVESFLKTRQTIESFALENGSNDIDSSVTSLSVLNSLFEDSYTYEGERSLSMKVSFTVSTQDISTVDIMVGDNIIGKDIGREISFSDNDIVCLDSRSTLIQSAETSLNLRRGSLQEFPTLGVSQEQLTNNINSLQFPSIFRQIVEVFGEDDSFVSIELIDYGINEDSADMRFIITAINGLSTEQELRIFDDTFDNTFQ